MTAVHAAHHAPARWRFLLGDLRCAIAAADDRYARMLAGAYGTPLLPGNGAAGEACDLAITIHEEPRAGRARGDDRLIVTRTASGCVLASDPMTWTVSAGAGPWRIEAAIHDPGLREDALGYHFWILLNRALLVTGRVMLHAAALAFPGSVSLFAGPKGSGKSTIAIALAGAGAEILADDHVIARPEGARMAVSGCNARLRVTAETERHFLDGRLGAETVDVAGVPKKEFAASRFFACRPHEERLVDRLFFPRLGRAFDARPLHRRGALLRLVADTATMLRFHDRADYADFLASLADLVGRVECYDLVLSPQLGDLDRLVSLAAGSR